MNVILVDDDQDDVYFFKQACRQVESDVQLVSLGNGKELCEYLESKKHQPNDIVLLDLNMPIMGGLDALTYIRNDIGNVLIPILIYTTSKNGKDIEECYRNGANSYIKKLDSIGELAGFLTSLIGYWSKYNRTA